jgi:predicted nucleotidyltransferase
MISEQQINIIINTLKPFKPSKIVGLQMELQDKLQKEVDLVEFTAIHPRLKARILNDAKIVYET